MSTINKLFLVCPDCYLEHSISLYYPGNAYFLTSLGAVFDFSDPVYAKTVRDFMQEEEIEQLYFVNACSCRFIQTALSQKKGYNTLAEAELMSLVLDHHHDFERMPSTREQKKYLATLNIERQYETCLTNPLLNSFFENRQTELKGLVIDKNEHKFSELNLIPNLYRAK